MRQRTFTLLLFTCFCYFSDAQCDGYIDSYYDSAVQTFHHFGINRSAEPPLSLDVEEKDNFFKISLSIKTAGLKVQKSDSIEIRIALTHGENIRQVAHMEVEQIGKFFKYSAVSLISPQILHSLGKHLVKNVRIGYFYAFVDKDQAHYFKSVAHCLDKKIHKKN